MIVAILVLGLFIVAFLIGAFNSLIDLIRSSKFIDVSAEKVDHVSQYSKEWGKYYPELYEKRLKFEGFLDKAEDKINTVSDKYLPPVEMRKRGKDIYIQKREPIDLSSDDNTGESVYIYEYKVGGKSYYFEQFSDPSVLTNNEKDKRITIKYDPKKPSHAIIAKHSFRNLIICLIMLAIFVFIALAVIKY